MKVDYDIFELEPYIQAFQYVKNYDKCLNTFIAKLRSILLEYLILNAIKLLCETTITDNLKISKKKISSTIRNIYRLNLSNCIIQKKYAWIRQRILKLGPEMIINKFDMHVFLTNYLSTLKNRIADMLIKFYTEYDIITLKRKSVK